MAYRLGCLQFPPGCHVKEDPFSGPVNAESSSLLINVGNHHTGHLVRIYSESPLSKAKFLQALKQALVEFGLFHNGESDTNFLLAFPISL